MNNTDFSCAHYTYDHDSFKELMSFFYSRHDIIMHAYIYRASTTVMKKVHEQVAKVS